jgi:hypothetical protein
MPPPPSAARLPATVLTALTGVPGLALAGAGLFHPHSLTSTTAPTWTWLHVVALFLFPLVGAGLVIPLMGRRDVLAWAVRLGAYVYATAYTALDVISGITAGYVTDRLPDGAPRPDEVRSIFAIGGPIGEVGSWALLAASVLLTVDVLGRYGARGGVAVLLPVGAWWVHVDHIFSPWGVLGMTLLGLGTAATTWLASAPGRGRGPAGTPSAT